MKSRALFILALAASPALAAISFDDALVKILERSTTIQGQEASRDAVHAKNLPSNLTLLPSISLEASKTRTMYDSVERETSGFVEGKAKLNLLKFGADFAAMKAATRENTAQDILVEDAVLKSEREGVSALIERIEAEMEMEIRKKMVLVQVASLEIGKQRFRQGLLAQQEVDKIEVDLQNARASHADAEIHVASAKAALEALLGKEEIQFDWPWRKELMDPTPKLGGPDRLKLRPDWRAAELAAAAADYRTDEKLGKVYPSLDFSFSYGYGQRDSSSQIGPSWEGRLSLTVPLFDNLTNYSEYRAQHHAKRRAEVSLEQTRRTALSEYESANVAYDTSVASAKSRDETLVTARKLYKDNVIRFQKGLVSANDLTVDQNRLANTELFAVKGWAAAHLAYTKLCHSLGYRMKDCRNQPRQ